MVIATPYGASQGLAIAAAMRLAEKIPTADAGAIFRAARTTRSVESRTLVMGIWLYDQKSFAAEAVRVLKLCMEPRGGSVWMEPALSSGFHEQDGWVAMYCIHLKSPLKLAVPEDPVEKILAEMPI